MLYDFWHTLLLLVHDVSYFKLFDSVNDTTICDYYLLYILFLHAASAYLIFSLAVAVKVNDMGFF